MTGLKFRLMLGALVFSNVALAGPVMDFIRSYDLNDYSLGVALSWSQSPYIGGDTSVFPYPYLTSFRDASFTEDWFLISEGDVGFRFVAESNWEFGLVGRMQTLGLGDNDAAELRGLSNRSWTLEVAPMIGYRGWPIHINAKTYFDLFGNHSGTTSELTLSLPRELERGFIIPSLRAIHRSEDFTNHYFGISSSEARPNRPEYVPGSSISTSAQVRWGYQIGDKWLLSAGIGVEFFDSAITDSPIIERDKVWSANVGLAYNSDIFQPRVSNLGDKRQPRLEFRLSAFSDSGDAKIIRDGSDGNPGDEIDLENILGVSDSETVVQFDAIYRINDFHRLEIGYHELERSGVATLGRDIRFGDTIFADGSTVETRFKSELLRFSYAYSLMNDAQKELGVMAGIHVTNGITDIISQTTGEREHADVSTPLPVVGLHGSVELGQHSTLGARIQLFAMEFDRLDGNMVYLMLEWQRRFGENFGAGIAYNYYRTSLESKDADAQGRLQTTHHGPVLFVSTYF